MSGEKSIVTKVSDNHLILKYDLNTVKDSDKWKHKYHDLKELQPSQISTFDVSKSNLLTNPWIDPLTSDIIDLKAKEWLDFELTQHDIIMLFFFTDPKLTSTVYPDILAKLCEYNQYLSHNNKNINGIVYGIGTNITADRLKEIQSDIKSSYPSFSTQLIRNSTCELGYKHNMICSDNQILPGICVFMRSDKFKKSSGEKITTPKLIYQIRTIDPKSEKFTSHTEKTDSYRTKQLVESDHTVYNPFELELVFPSPKFYSLVYGNPLTDFKNRYFSPTTGILVSLPNKENFYRLIKMTLNRFEEDQIFTSRLDRFKECAVKRLGKDYREIIDNPIPGISAQPLGDSDIFEWHVNIMGPSDIWYYENKIFHFEITFGPMYPMRPPEIRVKSSIPHPNIFGQYICLDLLSDYYDETDNSFNSAKYGWSTAYSIYSILITLQAFINDGLKRKIYGPDKKNSNEIMYHNLRIDDKLKNMNQYHCACGHKQSDPYPSFVKESMDSDHITKIVIDNVFKSMTEPVTEPVITNPFVAYEFDSSKIIHKTTQTNIVSGSNNSNKYSYLIGKTISVEVSNVMPFGAFVDISSYIMEHNNLKYYPRDISCIIPVTEYVISQIPKKGQIVTIKITSIDTKKPKVSNPRYANVIKFIGSMKAAKADQVIEINTTDIPHEKLITVKVIKIFDHNITNTAETSEIQNPGIYAENIKRKEKCFIRYDDVVNSFKPYIFYELSDIIHINDVINVELIGKALIPEIHEYQIFIAKPFAFDIPQRMARCSIPPLNLDQIPNLNQVALHESNLVCFHSRSSYKEDTLGIGVTVEYYDSGEISMIHPTCLDLISYDSFYNFEIKTSAWKNKFTHWIPLYLSAKHANNLELHEKFISLICQNKTNRKIKSLDQLPFSYHMVMKVLPVLMNTFIVIFMNGSIHESINALSAYTQIYRLLIAFCAKYPQIRADADQCIYNFIKYPDQRIKKVIPSIGEIIPLLSISTFTWNQMSFALLSEIFDRNVKWVLMQYPELGKMNELKETNIKQIFNMSDPNSPAEIEKEIGKRRKLMTHMYQKLNRDDYKKYMQGITDLQNKLNPKKKSDTVITDSDPDPNSEEKELSVSNTETNMICWTEIDRARFPKTFKANQVSLKLVMFHVYFLHSFRPLGFNSAYRLFSIANFLDQSFGRASPQIETDFQNQVKAIKSVDTFKVFFKMIDIPKPSNPYLLRWFRQSVINSLIKRYHFIQPVIKKITEDSNARNIKKPLPTLNTEDL